MPNKIKTRKDEMWDEFEKLQQDVRSALVDIDESYALSDCFDVRFDSLKIKIGNVIEGESLDDRE